MSHILAYFELKYKIWIANNHLQRYQSNPGNSSRIICTIYLFVLHKSQRYVYLIGYFNRDNVNKII